MADPIKALADAARSTCFQGLTKLYQFSSAETPKYLQSLGLWRKQETTNG